MAAAFKCDLCGNLYEKYEGVRYEAGCNQYFIIALKNESYGRYFDVCPDCMQEMIDFMHSRKENHD